MRVFAVVELTGYTPLLLKVWSHESWTEYGH